jgi:hypothetical protein
MALHREEIGNGQGQHGHRDNGDAERDEPRTQGLEHGEITDCKKMLHTLANFYDNQVLRGSGDIGPPKAIAGQIDVLAAQREVLQPGVIDGLVVAALDVGGQRQEDRAP